MAEYVFEALELRGPNRSQELRQKNASSINLGVYPGSKGYCECCQRHKPAPKKRNKGWLCDDCKLTISTT